jgi:anti-anti-sigma factor
VFEVRVEESDGRVRAVAVGELDLATRDRLEQAVLVALRSHLPVLVDLTGVTFIDSSGLQTLLDLDTAARKTDPPTTLRVLPGEQVRRVLALTALERRFTLDDADPPHTEAEADG